MWGRPAVRFRLSRFSPVTQHVWTLSGLFILVWVAADTWVIRAENSALRSRLAARRATLVAGDRLNDVAGSRLESPDVVEIR